MPVKGVIVKSAETEVVSEMDYKPDTFLFILFQTLTPKADSGFDSDIFIFGAL